MVFSHTTENPLAVVTEPRPNEAIVSYAPTWAQQQQSSADGIRGQFMLQYDIQRQLDGGDIQVLV